MMLYANDEQIKEYAMKVSIVLPVYNAAKHLATCLESLLNQTYVEFEVIIVDDGSTDGSANVMEDYRKKDDRIKCFSIKHGNVSVARNFALTKITGHYAAFVDADDWCEKTYLQELIQSMENMKSDLSACGCSEILGEKIIERYLEDYDPTLLDRENGAVNLMAFLAERNVLSACWGKLYKADLIRENKIHFSEIAIVKSDIIFNMEYLLYCKYISFVKKPLYNYVKYSSSLSSRRDPDAINTIQVVINEKLRVLERSNISRQEIELRIRHWKIRAAAFACYREITSSEYFPFSERYTKSLLYAELVKQIKRHESIDLGRIKKRTVVFIKFLGMVNGFTLPLILVPTHLRAVIKNKNFFGPNKGLRK